MPSVEATHAVSDAYGRRWSSAGSGVRAVYKSYGHLTPVVDVVVELVTEENGTREVRRGVKLTSVCLLTDIDSSRVGVETESASFDTVARASRKPNEE